MTVKKRLSPPVVFLAPGGGLGHIVRASAVALQLEKKEIPTLIVTTSGWAEGLGRITGLAMTVIPQEKWGGDIERYLDHIRPGLIIQDAFPFGFKNEDLSALAERIPFIYFARVLKLSHYLKTLNKVWENDSPLLSTIIKIEPLPVEQNASINNSGQRLFELERRICFPFEDFVIKRPPLLERLLDESNVHLVVHSGPAHEIKLLVKKAEMTIKGDGQGEIAVINPQFFRQGVKNAFDYFPAAALYSRAYQIYSGGGYNAVAEQDACSGKVTRIPFDRYYDDQAFRIRPDLEKVTASMTGTQQATEIISGLYDELI